MTAAVTNRPMNRQEAAAYLGLSPATLAADVCRPRLRIKHMRAGRRCVYFQADLDAWIASHKVEV